MILAMFHYLCMKKPIYYDKINSCSLAALPCPLVLPCR